MSLSAAEIIGEAAIPELLSAISPVDPSDVAVVSAPAILRRSWGTRIAAMTIGTKVFVEPEILEVGGRRLRDLVIHELVHVRQWRETRPAAFLSEYVGQYLLARLRGAAHHVAYMSIEAEIEARRVVAEIKSLLDN